MHELPGVPSSVHRKPHEGSSWISRTLSIGASSTNTMEEFQVSSVSDQILLFSLSSDLDDYISRCLASAAHGQNRLESICRQTKTHWYNTTSKSKPENPVQRDNSQQKLVEGHKKQKDMLVDCLITQPSCVRRKWMTLTFFQHFDGRNLAVEHLVQRSALKVPL